jgi:hypothetical protein
MPPLKFALATAILLCAFAYPARAEENCAAVYEKEADKYWSIVSDIMKFKAMFDDYDRLCQAHYPEEIAALQPAADLLRTETDRDLSNTKAAMTHIFDAVLPGAVGGSCADDSTARNSVKKKFLGAMDHKSKTLEMRLKKSAKTLQSPKENLTLCTQLKPMKPKIEKALGKGLQNPLLEMSVLNRTLTRSPKHDKIALKSYRASLKEIKK